jgi:hypothetical protein
MALNGLKLSARADRGAGTETIASADLAEIAKNAFRADVLPRAGVPKSWTAPVPIGGRHVRAAQLPLLRSAEPRDGLPR